MKKTILYKEKTNKMYLLILCGLLVSGAIVCSTNDNGDNGNQLMFACPNGTAVMPTADNMPAMAGEENCTECTTAGFMLEDVEGSDRMVCRTPYVCPYGTVESGTTSMANVENCASCDPGFGDVMQGERTICQPEFACPNGTAVMPTADNMPAMAGEENCTECTTAGFMLEDVEGSDRMVCRTPYVCPYGTVESGTTSMANVENCASCDPGFGDVMQGERTICQPEFVCPRGTIQSGTTTTANVENCASCDPGFGDPVAAAGSDPQRSICSDNDLPIALWNAGSHDGDFGFGLCQNRIAEDSTDTIGSDLRSRGYTKAVFFGSTGTGAGDYLFIDIGSDADALALPATGGGSPGSVSGRNIVVFTVSSGSVSVTNTFGSPTAVTRTLGQVTNVAAGGDWQNGGADVVGAAGITATNIRAWSFTLDREHSASFNCTGATNNARTQGGHEMNSVSVDGGAGGNSASTSCNTVQFVLCVAR